MCVCVVSEGLIDVKMNPRCVCVCVCVCVWCLRGGGGGRGGRSSSGGRGRYSLVAAVPLPGVPRSVGHEVGRALVLHPLREAQEDPDVVVRGLGRVGGAGGTERTHTHQDTSGRQSNTENRV